MRNDLPDRMTTLAMTPERINAMTGEEFVATFGSLFEHSDWVARDTWPRRPFSSKAALLEGLLATLRCASPEAKIKLIQAHPDLAGRLAQAGKLTEASNHEQASAGLNRLTPQEAEQFQTYNDQYRAKFGFPFVVCARLLDRERILQAFRDRLPLEPAKEMETAVREIEKIAALRLDTIMPE